MNPVASSSGVGFGVDVGGTGIKAASVDLATGRLASERERIDTPQPAVPEAVAEVVAELVSHHDWSGPLGICLPAVVSHGVVRSAANIDDRWIGVDAGELFGAVIDNPLAALNDADAAGVAETTWGVGRGRSGVVIVLTFGTGIGSSLFVDGQLVPNTELGHLELDGHNAESRAAARARKTEDLTWTEWAERVDRYLAHVASLFSPDLIVLGGGVSKKPEKWVDRLDPPCETVVAEFANNAGIAGAAMFAPHA